MSIVAPLPSGYMGGSWSQDQGVDINGGTSAIANQPLLAIGSGTVVKHGISGFGPDAPVLKLDTPIDGYDYVYYGHAGPGTLPIGTHVNAGDIIGKVGAGIVGISSGPHLEIGFADVRGVPVPGSSSTMLSLLKGAKTTSDPVAQQAKQQVSGGGVFGLSLPSLPDLNPYDAVKRALEDLFNSIVSHAKYAALTFIVIIGGFILIGKGTSRATHSEAPA